MRSDSKDTKHQVFNHVLHHVFNQMIELSGSTEKDDDSWQKPQGLAALRERLTTSLAHLQDELQQQLSERQTYQVLFPIIVFFDEAIQVRLSEDVEWKLLQKEFFDIHRGGAVFFESLDELIQEDAPVQVFQSYYFCLKLGFQGRHAGDQRTLDSYLEKIKQRLPLPADREVPHTSGGGKILSTSREIYSYYIAASVAACALYVVLRVY